jgi:hypothetical protein
MRGAQALGWTHGGSNSSWIEIGIEVRGTGSQFSNSAATTYSPRVYETAQNSYTFNDNTWTVYDKKGTRYTYDGLIRHISGDAVSGKEIDRVKQVGL